MSNDRPMAYLHERLQESADAQQMTVRCRLCPKWVATGAAAEVREEAKAHRVKYHPELVDRKVVRKRRVFSHAMTEEREAQIEEERRQRMRALGIS